MDILGLIYATKWELPTPVYGFDQLNVFMTSVVISLSDNCFFNCTMLIIT